MTKRFPANPTSTRPKNAIGKSRIQQLHDDKVRLDKFFRKLTDYGKFRDESYEFLRKDLRQLQEEGVDLKQLELVLRSIPFLPDKKPRLGPWHDIRWAENLSKRLRAIAEDLDGVLKEGYLFLAPINTAMAIIKGAPIDLEYMLKTGHKVPENIRDTPGQMRKSADYLEWARGAWKFFPRPSLRASAFLFLFELVRKRKGKPNLAILERLLNAVFDAIGQESQYTASWLNTFYRRNNLSDKRESIEKRLASRRP